MPMIVATDLLIKVSFPNFLSVISIMVFMKLWILRFLFLISFISKKYYYFFVK